jgi:hypothetical protein
MQHEAAIPKDVDERSYTRAEFCALERMSPSTYAKLQKIGRGPTEIRFPGMSFARITAAARREWHRKNMEWAETDAGQLEKERRKSLALKAGKESVASRKAKKTSKR